MADGATADAEEPGEKAGDDAGGDNGQSEPDQLSERHFGPSRP